MSNLLCCNCQAVFGDNEEVDSPTCPYCGVSHYEETTSHQRTPQRDDYKKYVSFPEVIDEYWLPYFILQNIVENISNIDLKLAHEAGLLLCGKDVDSISWVRVLNCLRTNTYNRQSSRETPFLEDIHDLAEEDRDLEIQFLMTELIADLRKKWNQFGYQRAPTSQYSLEEAAFAHWRVDFSLDEKRIYKSLKNRLNRFRKSVEKQPPDVHIYAASETERSVSTI